MHSSRTGGCVGLFVERSPGDRREHSTAGTRLPGGVPRALSARLQLQRVGHDHPVLAETVERVVEAILRLNVRVAPPNNCNFNTNNAYAGGKLTILCGLLRLTKQFFIEINTDAQTSCQEW